MIFTGNFDADQSYNADSWVDVSASLSNSRGGSIHYTQSKHSTQDEFLAHGHLQSPKHRHRHDHDRNIQQQIEYANIQIQTLLISARPARYRTIPIERYRSTDQTCSHDNCDEEGKVDTVNYVAGYPEGAGTKYANVECENRSADEKDGDSPGDLANEQSLL